MTTEIAAGKTCARMSCEVNQAAIRMKTQGEKNNTTGTTTINLVSWRKNNKAGWMERNEIKSIRPNF
jgi:hypothetical protein